jgi:hypothetical protein
VTLKLQKNTGCVLWFMGFSWYRNPPMMSLEIRPDITIAHAEKAETSEKLFIFGATGQLRHRPIHDDVEPCSPIAMKLTFF